jgi:hypothetical protein
VTVYSLLKRDSIVLNLTGLAKRNKPIFDYQRADVYAIDVTDVPGIEHRFLSIESFVTAVPNNAQAVFAVGFGATPIPPITLNMILNLPIKDSSDFFYKNGRQWSHNSYRLGGRGQGGTSGTPVFYVAKENPDSLIFGGIISSHFPGVDIIQVVKPSELMAELDRVDSTRGVHN